MSSRRAKARSGWTRVAFGDVIALSRERSSDPEEDGFERYVGLEHLEPGDLRIRTWGNVSDGTTFTNVFRSGQVLFGKRRAYQRKVAVADFDGVCSGDIYVLEPKDDHLLPQLLPFICQTDSFFEHAVGTSAGSLSPRTNWESLATYEFALPPLDEQRRIADLLQAAEEAVEAHRRATGTLETLDASVGSNAHQATRALIGDVIADTDYGSSARSNKERRGVRIIGIPNVLRGQLDLSDVGWVNLSTNETERYLLHEGDVLVVRTNGNPLYVGRCLAIPALDQPTVFASYLIRLKPNLSRVRPGYLAAALNSAPVRRLLRRQVRSSAGNYNVNTTGLRETPIPLPSLQEQDSVLSRLAAIRQQQAGLVSRVDSIRRLRKAIVEGSFT
jgi:type I restriction enzyme S subunit